MLLYIENQLEFNKNIIFFLAEVLKSLHGRLNAKLKRAPSLAEPAGFSGALLQISQV
jgi:hypothetical protein